MGKDRREPYNATGRRLTVDQAADVLGISVEAVRGRIRRGTIGVEREKGRVYVLLDTDQSRQPTDQPTDQPDRTDALIAELQDRVRSLEEANRENRRIIAALTQRIPAIESPAQETPQEPPESPTGATEQPGRVERPPEVEGTQEGTEPRSWWQRLLGG